MNTEESVQAEHAERMLNALREAIPGYIEDVARYLIAVARFRKAGPVECEYGGVVLRVDESSTVRDVQATFEREALLRMSVRTGSHAQRIAERESIGPRPMRALFAPRGSLAPSTGDLF